MGAAFADFGERSDVDFRCHAQRQKIKTKTNKQKTTTKHAEKSAALNALTAYRRVADADPEVLDFFAAAGKGDFELKIIGAIEVGRGVIKRDQGRHFNRQALLDIGRLERGAPDVDRAMRRRIQQTDRRQRARSAVRPYAGVDADPHIAPRRSADIALDQIRLRASITRRRAE